MQGSQKLVKNTIKNKAKVKVKKIKRYETSEWKQEVYRQARKNSNRQVDFL